jgi:hypothetical protein
VRRSSPPSCGMPPRRHERVDREARLSMVRPRSADRRDGA